MTNQNLKYLAFILAQSIKKLIDFIKVLKNIFDEFHNIFSMSDEEVKNYQIILK